VTSALLNEKGEVVEGDLDMLNSVQEVFTFERVLGSDNPNWVLIGVEEAGEDTLGSAPDFKASND
jgi:predicted lipid-binding transport protein (Tim44 family)